MKSSSLREILRADPSIIQAAEQRALTPAPLAKLARRSADAGHRIFTTLHSKIAITGQA